MNHRHAKDLCLVTSSLNFRQLACKEVIDCVRSHICDLSSFSYLHSTLKKCTASGKVGVQVEMDTCGIVQGTPTSLCVVHSTVETTRGSSVCTPNQQNYFILIFSVFSTYKVVICAECFNIIFVTDFEHFTQEL